MATETSVLQNYLALYIKSSLTTDQACCNLQGVYIKFNQVEGTVSTLQGKKKERGVFQGHITSVEENNSYSFILLKSFSKKQKQTHD